MSGTATTKRDRQQAVREKAKAMREAERRRAKRRRAGLIAVVVAGAAIIVALVVVIVSVVGSSPTVAVAAGPEGIPLEQGTVLASDTTSSSGATADGIQCAAQEQVAYHVHTHLAVYVNGTLRPIPAGIGLVQPEAGTEGLYGATQCYYWLHVHAQDGVIHVESPTTATYTLGQFFAVWQQPLSSTQVAGAKGTVTAFVNGKRYTGDPAKIPLGSREAVQLDVGTAVPFTSVDWSQSQL